MDKKHLLTASLLNADGDAIRSKALKDAMVEVMDVPDYPVDDHLTPNTVHHLEAGKPETVETK